MATQRPKTRNSANMANSQKRKREEDLETAPVPKVARTDRDGKMGRRKAKVPFEEDPLAVSNRMLYILIGKIDTNLHLLEQKWEEKKSGGRSRTTIC